ncbi:MAG: ABC transporter ATP-binding protein, partial [Ferrovibrio sp.]
QRIALARALITDPSVLLLDEPLSALDPFLRAKMREELKRLQKELGISFIHVTHSQEEAMALADLVVVMNRGRIEQADTARAVFNHPRTAFVARFIGGHNIVSEGARTISVRADRASLAPVSSGGAGFSGTVRAVEYLGSVVNVGVSPLPGSAYVVDQDEFLVAVGESSFFTAPVALGDAVAVSWKLEDIHVLEG